MLTFRQFLNESGVRSAASVGIALRIRNLNQQIVQDRTASKAEKLISQELLWLSGMVAMAIVTEKGK